MSAPRPEFTRRVVILGGGTAGWMVAASLARHLNGAINLTLVESPEIGIIGVGEATLPHLRDFLASLEVDETTFMEATHATYKLGILFDGFGSAETSYFHPFGTFGQEVAGVGFHHFWLRAGGGKIDDYALGIEAARQCKFAPPDPAGSPLSATYNYAYQFDATRFGPFLQEQALKRGAKRLEARVTGVERDAQTGSVSALRLEDGTSLEADLFVDCSGFRSLLLGDALEEAWEDWSQWLPCDRAVALPCTSPEGDIEPYTRAIAMPAGWRWRIPLQNRLGNGYVYSSAHLSEDEASAAILEAVEGEPLADPRTLRFKAGRRRRGWVSNVVAIGLASGFLEPLESTSIYLVQAAIGKLIDLFPIDGIEEADRDEFNRLMDMEYDRIRDFLILHYHATERSDSGFWNHVREMDIPESLQEKMDLWRRTGRVAKYGEGLFFEPSWVAVYLGQGIVPDRYDARAEIPSLTVLRGAMDQLRRQILASVEAMPGHRSVLADRFPVPRTGS